MKIHGDVGVVITGGENRIQLIAPFTCMSSYTAQQMEIFRRCQSQMMCCEVGCLGQQVRRNDRAR